MGYDVKFMERAIKLAKLGIGRVDPNPLVGAVIVKDGRVIGEGYHTGYGMPHAEREAINNLTEPAQGAEMYVTLEPCAHTGKQPPCTAAIIDAGIRTVYIGSIDPNPLVNGKGIWMLRHHGIEVVTGVMKKECDALNRAFFHYITTKQPYVVLKYAMTLDGKIATVSGESRYISAEFSRGRVRAMRNQYQAIIVGIGTVMQDDPMLNTRRQKDRVPTRIICDTHLRIPMDSQIVKSAGQMKTYIACGEESVRDKENKIRELEVDGVEILKFPEKDGHLDVVQLILKLGEMGISGVMIEGGGRLAWSFIREGLVNEIDAFMCSKVFGGAAAVSPVEGAGFEKLSDAIPFHLVESEILPGGDIYAKYIVGPEPEEEEGVEILPAEPQPIRRIKGQETKLLEVNLEEDDDTDIELTGDVQEPEEKSIESLSTGMAEAQAEAHADAKADSDARIAARAAADAVAASSTLASEAAKVKMAKATGAGSGDSWGAEEDDGWDEADSIPVTASDDQDEDPQDGRQVELESRIVTEVLSADLNPFNIGQNKQDPK